MPRAKKGGMVPGRQGQQYPNRTDLSAQPSLPARVATGQTYGKATQQLQAQRTVPMAPQPVVPSIGSPSPTQGSPGGGSPSPAPGLSPIPPGAFGPIDRPTERPHEPVSAGAKLGPGPGPETIQQPLQAMQQANSVSSVLQKAAASFPSALLQQMAARAQAAGQ